MYKEQIVQVAASGTYSEAFTVEPWAMFYGVLFPAMDDGAIGLEISDDGGSNYYPVIDPADGADAVLVASGSDPGWVDISDWIRFLCHGQLYKARFTCVEQSSGAVNIKVVQRSRPEAK